MNFTLDENNSFEQLISNVCDKISNSKYKVKKEFGIEPELIKGKNGIFDVVAEENLIFSKHEVDRFPDESS